MANVNTLYSEATWSTDRFFSKKVTDNIFASNPVAMMLRKNARTIGGGESLELSTAFAKGTGEWFTEFATYQAVYTEQLGAGRLEWKLYTTPVVLSIMQLLKNGESEERRYDLAMQKNILAAKTAADDLGIALFATTQVTNAVDTLDNAVAAGTTTYANITRAATGAGATWLAVVDSTTTTLSLSAVQTNYGDASEGAEQPNLLVMTQANYNRLYDLYTPIQRVGSDEMGKAGFRSLLFNMIPAVVDSHVATGYVYGFNMNHIEMVAHREAFFSFEKYVVPSNQWVSIGRYFFMGNVLCHAPRYQFKMTAITA